MASLNSVNLVGRLTEDPSLEYTKSGSARSNFTIAINSYSGDDEETTFVPITCWGNQAENSAEYLSKGSQVAIDGRLRISNYEDSNGNNRKWTEVVARSVQFLSSNKNNQSQSKESKDSDKPPFDT